MSRDFFITLLAPDEGPGSYDPCDEQAVLQCGLARRAQAKKPAPKPFYVTLDMPTPESWRYIIRYMDTRHAGHHRTCAAARIGMGKEDQCSLSPTVAGTSGI